ncbi:MAG: sulfurtransferase [Chloroflexota bacterium]
MGVVGILSVKAVSDNCQRIQIIDARPRSVFDAGHIPGAISMGWEEWCDIPPVSEGSILQRPGYWGVLRQTSRDWYEDHLTSQGLRSHDPIVVYADGPRSRGREGRIAWMLLYLGAAAVSLLDGGWQAWVQMGGDVERELVKPPGGHFPVLFQEERRWTLAQVTNQRETRSRPHFVDTRSVEEFTGELPACQSFRGHIPGAGLLSFTTLFDAKGRYIDQASFVHALPSGARHTDDIVAYCEVGVRASLFALLHEAYTGRLVSVFDGSVAEWALQSGLALQTGTTSE